MSKTVIAAMIFVMWASNAHAQKTTCVIVHPTAQQAALAMDGLLRSTIGVEKSMPPIERFPASVHPAYLNFQQSQPPLLKALREYRDALQDLARALELCAR